MAHAHIRHCCLQEGRIEALSSILDIAAVHAFLSSDAAALPSKTKFLFGLYSACVLTSGDWLARPLPRSPVQVSARTS
jgi:hypothetical protein